MKLALTLVLTLLFLALESVAVKYVGLGVARIDVTVALRGVPLAARGAARGRGRPRTRWATCWT